MMGMLATLLAVDPLLTALAFSMCSNLGFEIPLLVHDQERTTCPCIYGDCVQPKVTYTNEEKVIC